MENDCDLAQQCQVESDSTTIGSSVMEKCCVNDSLLLGRLAKLDGQRVYYDHGGPQK